LSGPASGGPRRGAPVGCLLIDVGPWIGVLDWQAPLVAWMGTMQILSPTVRSFGIPLNALKEGLMSSRSKLRGFLGVLCAGVVAISGAAAEPERRPELGEEPGAAAKVNVGVVIHEGVELLDFAGPGEVFKQAGFRVFTVAPSHEPITSMEFVKVIPEFAITDSPRIDILVIPGGNTNVLLNNSAVIEWIKKTSPGTKLTLTVCTGAFALAETGLLDGLKATTHYSALSGLRSSYPKVTVLDNERFVDNGKYVTTAGISAGIDGSLHVVARMLGDERAWTAARQMQYNWDPPAPANATSEEIESRAAMKAWIFGDWNAAAKAYESIAARRPDDLKALCRLGASQCNSGDFAKGLPNLELAVKRGRSDARTLADLARFYLMAQKYAESITTYEKAIAAGIRDRGTSRYNLGCAYALAGRKEEAIKSIDASIDDGFTNLRLLQTDVDLESLRSEDKFRAVVGKLEARR
jgi:putative intracellular protease/amidase